MTATHHCPRCGSELSPDAKAGLCPTCQMQAVLRDDETQIQGSDETAVGGDEETVPTTSKPTHLPTIPRYRIIQLIGAGGMGEVYKAEQRTPVQRFVAIKVIKLGMDSQEVLARFENEQQALAMLNHPNVAAVFDAGITQEGRPYFVMEHVSGEPITRFCDRHNCSTRQRLELFIQACEAIQHAHQKAIIHRDLKPSNLLVTLDGGKPLVKVIDFGVAKAMTQRLTERTMFTEIGQLIGTPEYMSPEQAEMSVLDVDTRTDIYSLGVVLYELLSGTLPFESASLRQGGYAEVQRFIREMDAPRPSTRLSTLGARASEIAKHHQMDLRWLRRELKRELEWIPLMAMRKDRARRYRTATEMADDIHAYLEHRPLIAGPESAQYRFRKFVRRHRVGTAFAVLVLLGVVLTAFLAIWNRELYAREKLASGQAIAARDEARHSQANEATQRIRAEKGELTARQQLYAGNINLAQQAWDSADVDRAIQLLDSLRPRPGEEDQRGFEWWRLLKLTRSGNQISAPQESSLRPVPAILSPDGGQIATARGPAIRIWQKQTGSWNDVASLPDQQDIIRCIAFSPTGRLLWAGGSTPDGKGIALAWDAQSRASRVLRDFAEPVIALAFSPDGSTIAISCRADAETVDEGAKNRITLWNVSTLERTSTFSDALAAVSSLAFSPDGKVLAGAATIEGKVITWDLTSGTMRRSPQLANYVSAIAFSPSGQQLSVACGTADDAGFIRTLDPKTLAPDPTMNLTGHVEGINALAYSADGRRLVSAGCDRTARLWDAATGAPLSILRGHRRDVVSACFDGNTIVTRGADDAIRLWDASQQKEETIIPHLRWQVAFSPSGMLAGVHGNLIKVFDDAGRLTTSLEMQGYQGETALAFSHDEKYLAAGNVDGFVRVWKTADWGVAFDLPIATRKVRFSRKGQTLALVGVNGIVQFWNMESLHELEHPTIELRAADLAFSDDGKSVAVIGVGGVLIGKDQTALSPLANAPGGECIAFSPDSKWLFTSRGRDLSRSEIASGDMVTTRAQGRTIAAMIFSSDGKRLITASTGGDGCVQLWNVNPLGVVATYANDSSSFISVAMSPRQHRLAAIRTRNGSSEAVVWEAADQKSESVTSK